MSLPAQGMSLKAKNLSPKAESEPVGRSESENKQPEPEPASREWEPESRRYGIESHVSAVSLLESRALYKSNHHCHGDYTSESDSKGYETQSRECEPAIKMSEPVCHANFCSFKVIIGTFQKLI